MKIINKENGQEKIYVQIKDIKKLWEFCSYIPFSIFNIDIENMKMSDFIELNDKELIDFFKEQEWIIDYKKIRKLSKDDLEECMNEIKNQMTTQLEKQNNTTSVIDRILITKEYNSLDYKLEDIKTIHSMKINNDSLDLPLVPDSDGFSLESDNKDLPYKLSVSINPNSYLLYRKDGKKLKEDEEYPAHFIQTGLSLAFIERNDLPQSGDCELSFDYSEDKSYLIIKMNIIDKTKEESKEQTQERGFKKVLNKIFKRKNN